MRSIGVILAIVILSAAMGCKKSAPRPDLRHVLVSHKWYYKQFFDGAQAIHFNVCDSNNYLLFYEGGKAAVVNDNAVCNRMGKPGVFSTFSYTYLPDSGVIRVHDFGGGDYTWLVLHLDDHTFEIQFVFPVPPPDFDHDFDYIYTSRQ